MVEVSVNATVSGTAPDRGVPVKLATGAPAEKIVNPLERVPKFPSGLETTTL
jgi:hypothetical protein